MSGILHALLTILTHPQKEDFINPVLLIKEMASKKLDKMPKVTHAVNSRAEYLK